MNHGFPILHFEGRRPGQLPVTDDYLFCRYSNAAVTGLVLKDRGNGAYFKVRVCPSQKAHALIDGYCGPYHLL